MDLVYTNADWVEVGTTSAFSLDIAFGEDENDFSIRVGTDITIPFGALVYIDGTPWGGIIRGIEYQYTAGKPINVYSGDTWHGVLGHSVIRPDAGQDYYTVTGDLNACIQTIVTRQGLTGLFDVENIPCGKSVSHQFERYCTAYSGISKMLDNAGYKLCVVKDASSKPLLSAVPLGDFSNDGQTYNASFIMTESKPVNHLVCLGEGNLHERVVIDLFADVNGNISTTQTIFGIDEITEVYDYSNADSAQLLEDGTKRLTKLQATKTAELNAPDGLDLEIGDVVGVYDDDSGRSLVSKVAKVLVKISTTGLVTKSYALGDINAVF